MEDDYKKPGLAAFLLALKSDEEIRNFMLIGDDIIIDLSTCCYCDAVYYLLTYYYCFNLNYPPIYNEFLVAFQVFCLKQTESIKMGIAFKKFETELRQYLVSEDTWE